MSNHGRSVLTEQTIDVWLAFYDEICDSRTSSVLREPLSDEERKQETKFYFDDDRRRYLVTRAMVRTVLSRYCAIAPSAWVFSANAYGRPEIASPDGDALGLCFNISHAKGLIALAVTRDRSVGIDVENIEVRDVSLGIAERFFSRMEAAELAALPEEHRWDRFFEYWTLKESYVKARGMGLSIPLNKFSFRFTREGNVQLAVEPELGDDEERWRFWQYRASPRHLLAVCAGPFATGTPTVTLRKLTPTFDEEAVETMLLRASNAPCG
jgi:4'-phosphopantetheinyl transferase